MKDYSLLSKIFHSLILGNKFTKSFLFDLNYATHKSIGDIEIKKLVFVSGLARSGTTMLLKALYSTGEFVSLTYGEMPFIMAPQFSKNIFFHKKDNNYQERVHGDGLKVGVDSPEAFDEVFWLTYKNEDLDSKEIKKKYKFFVKSVLDSKNGTKKRYLSKNNNLERIDSLCELKDSIIVVPFREPLAHAGSMLGQHLRFLDIQKKDRFVLWYMNWLGHFEFGNNYKPLFGKTDKKDVNKLLNINFWLDYWIDVHSTLLQKYKDKVIFLSYDRLCESPEKSFAEIEKILSLKKGSIINKNINKISKYNFDEINKERLADASSIYSRLLSLSRI